MTAMTGRLARKTSPLVVALLVFSTAGAQTESEWRLLFDGRSLEGWTVRSLEADRAQTFWTVENGAIQVNSIGRPDHDYVWLMTNDEYRDFELKLSFQAFRESAGNSGIQVRSRYDDSADAPRGGWLDGPQVDVHPPLPWRIGMIYDETRTERRWISPSLPDWNVDESYGPDEWRFEFADEGDGWNDLLIRCAGTRMTVTLNGLVMNTFDGRGVLDDEAHARLGVGLRGHIALQLHSGDELLMRFRDIRIREL
jgi:hypothetical protein